MNAELLRFAYTPTETQGKLIIGDWSCWTIERPWLKGPHKGGMPFESCIPDGEYALVPFTRSNGDRVLALRNPDLGVDLEPGAGRYAILIHAGNYVTDVVGCIAPGYSRIIHRGQVMVTASRTTAKELFRRIGDTLTIRNATGAAD